mgnify:CR=1 FL=1
MHTADGSDPRHVVYCWQGRHSSNAEAGGAMLQATDMHTKQFGGRSTLTRVEQNAEPAHFTRLFK